MGSAVDGDGDAPYASRQGGPMDLRLEAVSHRFDALAVLDHIDLTARDGEILALIGPSGCGQSTLLQIAGGMLRPTAGAVTTAGAPPAGRPNQLGHAAWRGREVQEGEDPG